MPVNGRWSVDDPLVSITLAAPLVMAQVVARRPLPGAKSPPPATGNGVPHKASRSSSKEKVKMSYWAFDCSRAAHLSARAIPVITALVPM
jgi:hypothetical protein